MQTYDVVIIGGGIAGLGAANRLLAGGQKNILVLEAQDKIGGRIQADYGWDNPVELGAEFVHGHNPLLWELFKKCNIAPVEQPGYEKRKIIDDRGRHMSPADTAAFNTLHHDCGINGTLGESFVRYVGRNSDSIKAIIIKMVLNSISDLEGGDASELDVGAYTSSKTHENNYTLPTTYAPVIHELSKGVPLRLNAIVDTIDYQSDTAHITLKDGTVIAAKKVIITTSLGVLKSGAITFTPALPPTKMAAIQKIGMGDSLKIMLKFTDTNIVRDLMKWRDGSAAYVVHSPFMVSTWWQPATDASVLTGFIGGSRASQAMSLGEGDLIQACLFDLQRLIGYDVTHYLFDSLVIHWGKNPYTLGSYSNDPVGSSRALRQELARPVSNQLFFAGEATHSQGSHGTVHGALESGMQIADMILRTDIMNPTIRLTGIT